MEGSSERTGCWGSGFAQMRCRQRHDMDLVLLSRGINFGFVIFIFAGIKEDIGLLCVVMDYEVSLSGSSNA
ncbi:hypothetical protein TIFTF001_049010 [Ficus carica]|uniref:Uncharacterized protein n=1 Tax=Ficus carica TaxID=3494 RepID=A0AA87YTI3_FICCA|nr:hypothetical protein TIFTF001_049009 [Ficus carica]GMN22635.1 hypothetical protein TIFTF001_049010 [Ficus carica]